MYNLIDATYQLHRAVFVSGMLAASSGEPTGGTFVFLRMLWNLKDSGNTILVFDYPGARAPFRKELLPEYKKREKDESEGAEERKKHFKHTGNTLRDILPKMGFPALTLDGQEGDDVLYRLAQGLRDRGEEVRVVSDDEDYLQFVNLGVNVYQPMKDRGITLDNFKEVMEIDPEYFILWKSLIGDGSDNIGGVKGIGKKTATKIMDELEAPTFEALHKWASSGKKKIHQKVFDGFSLVKRNSLLIDINNVPLTKEEVFEEYERSKSEVTVDDEYVINVFRRMEFKQLGQWVSYLTTRSNSGI